MELSSNRLEIFVGFISGILSAIILYYYWTFKRSYAGFPSYPLAIYMLYRYLTRTIPRQIPFTSFLFQKLVDVTKKYESEGLCLTWGYKPLLFIFGEESVKLFTNEQAALDKSYKYEALQDIFGTGLITSNGDTWRKHRKMFNPVFHMGMLKDKLPIYNEYAEMLVENLLNEAVNKPSVDMLDYLKACSFGILSESIIGLKVNCKENRAGVAHYFDIITKLSEYSIYRITRPWLQIKFILHLLPSYKKYAKLYEDNHNFTKKAILEMKETLLGDMQPDIDTAVSSQNRKSFTRILLEHHLKDPSFTIKDMQDELTNFMAAGYDTISQTLLWCLFMLGHHPDAQEKVYQELTAMTGEYISFEDLYELKYLECVIKETLRLYPTVPLYARHLKKDVQCGKYKVPKNTEILFFTYMLHRNPKIYPDPEKFDPNRFLDGNLVRPWTFVPFAAGIRDCIGKKFAMMEMKVILSHIIRNFKITSLDNIENLKLSWRIVLTSVEPLHIELTKR